MKMLKIKCNLVFFVAFLLSSCNDEFLERYPLDEVSPETFWNTESDLRVYNNSFYHLAMDDANVPILLGHPGNADWSGLWTMDEFSDNMVANGRDHPFYKSIRTGLYNVPSNPVNFGYRGWNFVRALNVGLANYDNADISQEIINRYAGEARLFRGWFYADKVSKFGDVHWIETELNVDSEELYAARTPREEVMDKVLEDLTFATENLPDDWNDGNDPGRLNRWAALLVKARVCLFEGTWRKYHGGTNADMWLQEAANASEELINNGPYQLYTTGDPQNDYNAFHRVLDLTGNPEVMYWRKYQVGIASHHLQTNFTRITSATKSMVDSYLATDGLPVSLSPLYQGDEEIEDVFENRDPRLRQTILHPEDKEKYQYHMGNDLPYPRLPGMGGNAEAATGYHIIKYYNVEDMLGKAYNEGETPAIVLRFAEALLIYAEAKAELGTITQADLDMSINQLRDRVGMPHLSMNVQMDPRHADDGVSALIVEIRRERRVEMFGEALRYDDLRRWKQGEELEGPVLGIRWNDAAIARYLEAENIETSVDPATGKTYVDALKGTDWANPVFDESKHYLWPIPLSVMAQNPNVEQNPGW